MLTLIHLRDWPMIAGEYNYEDRTGRVVSEEFVHRSINARKLEIWRQRTEGEDRMRLLGRRRQREDKKCKEFPHMLFPAGTMSWC